MSLVSILHKEVAINRSDLTDVHMKTGAGLEENLKSTQGEKKNPPCVHVHTETVHFNMHIAHT